MSLESITDLSQAILAFTQERPSMMAHNLEPGILEMNIALEAAEILEVAKLKPAMTDEEHKERLGSELADVCWYVFLLAEIKGIDLAEEILCKIAVNEGRFPADLFEGAADDFLKQYWERKKELGERR